ncbi:sugar porter family MFS transporter [Aspergillus affinis]|uniref:sugar porter family MFS transporter n=1 Tax=Aspergillus affinis TaxID=1070780 RepID=UPI0022FE8454|nr:putative MFS monosaccharide transporter [Aspergillus affinis]KAI9044111.1 putative MFS monosaccharide transporter [Aspergillus affinis]
MADKPPQVKDVDDGRSSIEGFSHHAENILNEREPYGPAGLAGLVANPFVFMCAACSTLGGLVFGYDQGVVSVILVMDQFLERFPEVGPDSSGFWKGLMTAMIELGALIGALNQGWIADMISRRYSIVVAVIVFTIGSILQTAAMDYAMLTVARFIGGLGIGMLSMVAPLYISEISPPECRGTLLVLEEFCIVLGIVIAYWITYGTRYMAGEWSWRLPFLLQMIPGFVLIAGVIVLPFSPRWLASKGRNDEALESLARLRRLPTSDKRVRQEYLDIQAEVRFHQEMNAEKHPDLQGGGLRKSFLLEMASWADCFKKGCWRRTHVGVGLMFFQQFVGINALIYYSPTLFETMGLDYDMQLLMSGILNVTQLVGVSSTVWTMDRFGRRSLLLWGALFMTISHVIIAVLVGLFSDNWPAHRPQGWASVALLLFYMISFGASWGPVGWAMPSEIFPSSLRAKGVALSTCSNWLNNFIIGLITPPLVQNTGFGAYTFFAVFCLLALIWTFVFVPETKGRTLEQMDHVFKDNSSESEQARRHAIEVEVLRAEQQHQDQRDEEGLDGV